MAVLPIVEVPDPRLRLVSEPVASAACADDFLAESWARAWARDNGGSDDYLIRRADGGFAARLFKTVGQQWYVMRQ